MKTFFIFNQFDDGLKYGVVDYDASHLQGKYINSAETNDAEVEELNELQENAHWCIDLSDFLEEYYKDSRATVVCAIECGFFP